MAAIIANRRFPFAIAATRSLNDRFIIPYSFSSTVLIFSGAKGASSISTCFRWVSIIATSSFRYIFLHVKTIFRLSLPAQTLSRWSNETWWFASSTKMIRFSDSVRINSISSSILSEYFESSIRKSQLFSSLNLRQASRAILVFPHPDCPWISTALFWLIDLMMSDVSSSLYKRGFDWSVVKRPWELRLIKASGLMKDPFPSGMPSVRNAKGAYFLSRSSAIASGPMISILESMFNTSAVIDGSRRGVVWQRTIRSIRDESICVLLSSRQLCASAKSFFLISDVELVNAAKKNLLSSTEYISGTPVVVLSVPKFDP